jgi:hypothetical protein
MKDFIVTGQVFVPSKMTSIISKHDADSGSGMEEIRIRDGKKSDPGSRIPDLILKNLGAVFWVKNTVL